MLLHSSSRGNPWQFLKGSPVANAGLLAFVILLGYGAYTMAYRAITLSREARENERRIKELTQKKEELGASLRELETAAAAERAGKERLNLKKQGEQVVVVLPEPVAPALPQPAEGFWRRAYRFFTDLESTSKLFFP